MHDLLWGCKALEEAHTAKRIRPKLNVQELYFGWLENIGYRCTYKVFA
jgi:hypothetical protein